MSGAWATWWPSASLWLGGFGASGFVGAGMPRPSQRIVVEQDGDWWTVSDEDGEFARATTIELTLGYVRCLMHGPGTSSIDRDFARWRAANRAQREAAALEFFDPERGGGT